MSLGSYLTSKTFFLQLFFALLITGVLLYLSMYWLTYTTSHGEEITVPNLSRLTEEQVEEKLDDLDLAYVLLDSVDYRANYPNYTVVQQNPLPGEKVKEGRKIYIKINSSGFSSVKLPNLINKSYREAVPTLKAIGLAEGIVTYIPHLAKDMVLEVRYKGRNINAGDKVLKSSKIDLVLGDGKESYVEEEEIPIDSLEQPIEGEGANE